MIQRQVALKCIAAGDIFHAHAKNDASFVCLALKVGENTIYARRMTTQSVHEFDRTTGRERPHENPLVIDSVAPLPDDIREILLGLDRKYREAEFRRAEDPDQQSLDDEAKLTKDEIRALLSAGKHYEDNPI